MNKEDHLQKVNSLNIKRISTSRAIRNHCFVCQNENWYSVNKCSDFECPLWAFRFGYDPFSKKGKTRMKQVSNLNLQDKPPCHVVGGVNLKENTNELACQIPEMPLSASLSAKTQNGISNIKARMLYFLYDRLRDGKLTFYQSEIENIHTAEFLTGETKARKYRQLNRKHDLSECIIGKKSQHRIKKTLQELDGILKGYGL